MTPRPSMRRRCKRSAGRISTVPENFDVNPKIARQLEAKRADDRERRRHRLGDRRGARIRHAAARRPSRPPVRRGQPARHVQPATCGADRSDATRTNTSRSTTSRLIRRRSRSTTRCCPKQGVLGFEYGYTLADPRTLVLWEGAVRRFRQRRAGHHRPVHRQRRKQVAAHVRPDAAVAARLRGPGAGALVGAAGALPAALRRAQHDGRQPHDAGELLPCAAPPAEAELPQAAGADDAEIAAAPQARGLHARRSSPAGSVFRTVIDEIDPIAPPRRSAAS